MKDHEGATVKSIYKYLVTVGGGDDVMLPAGAKLLTVSAAQVPPPVADMFHLWAEVDPEAPLVSRPLSIYGTGNALPDEPGRYLGTAFCAYGALVWHVYDPPEGD